MTRSSTFALLALLAAVPSPRPQETPEPPAEATEETPTPIAASDIPRRSEETEIRLSDVEAALVRDPAVEAIASALPTWSEELDAARATAGRRSPSELSLRELRDAQTRWSALGARLDDGMAVLESRATSLEEALEDVRSLGELWALTEEEVASDLPDSIHENIENVRGEVERVERAVQGRLGEILTLQSELAEQASSVRAELSRLDGALGAIRETLFTRDAPPIWSSLLALEDRRSLTEEAATSIRETWTSVQQYVVSNAERFGVQGFVFLALVWLFTGLRARAERFGEVEGRKPSLRALSRPVANAALTALLLTRVFHPHAPMGVFELNRLALLAPLLAILPGLVYSSMRLPLYGLAALYVLDLAVDLIPAQAQLARVLQLLLSGTALFGLASLLRRDGAAVRIDGGRYWRAALVAARVAMLMLAGAFVGNLVGMLRLSFLLTDATLVSAYLAVVLFAGTLVLESLLALLLESRLSRSFRSLSANERALRSLGVKLVRVVALASWALLTLGALQLLESFLRGLQSVLDATLEVGEIAISLGDVLALVITIVVAVIVSRVTRALLEEDVLPRLSLPRGVPGAISMLAHYAIIFAGFLFALAASGIELSRFAILAGAFGVGIGFGLQNVVNNFISGLILLFERPIQVGDTIELEALFGKVSRIGIRSSTVRTFEGAEVIVPNSHLIDSRVINWTFSDRLRRIEVGVGVAYGTKPRDALEILLRVAREHRDVLSDPEPYVLFEDFGESSLDFILRAWTANFDEFLRIRSELRVNVHDALESAGITIPFPQRDLHVKSMPELKAGPNGKEEADGEEASPPAPELQERSTLPRG